VSASFAETVKAGEPISSVLIGLFFFHEGTTLPTYLTLIPICLGVGVSSMQDVSFDILGFLAAAASNICFSSRAVLTKYMFKTQHHGFMDEVSIVCTYALSTVLDASLSSIRTVLCAV
jgi:drug/metabolite transporter (DMT)-like permease